MEHFEGNSRNVKEKDVYLLHLDTPRIILIASVIIGVVAASFLFGMNFPGKSSSNSFEGDFFSDNRYLFPEENHIPPAPDSGKFSGETTGTRADDSSEKKEIPSRSRDLPGGDILTADNIKEIIQPGGRIEQASSSGRTGEEAEPRQKDSPPAARVQPQPLQQKKPVKAPEPEKKEQKVIAVSAPTPKPEPMVNIAKPAIKSGSFSIQVAAYDTQAKAEQEARELKPRYDSYIDRTTVQGNTYFRVRIGPIESRENAMSLLHDVQNNPRYQNAYIIRE